MTSHITAERARTHTHTHTHPQTYIYSMLDAVPPIQAESSHVATDKDPSK